MYRCIGVYSGINILKNHHNEKIPPKPVKGRLNMKEEKNPQTKLYNFRIKRKKEGTIML